MQSNDQQYSNAFKMKALILIKILNQIFFTQQKNFTEEELIELLKTEAHLESKKSPNVLNEALNSLLLLADSIQKKKFWGYFLSQNENITYDNQTKTYIYNFILKENICESSNDLLNYLHQHYPNGITKAKLKQLYSNAEIHKNELIQQGKMIESDIGSNAAITPFYHVYFDNDLKRFPTKLLTYFNSINLPQSFATIEAQLKKKKILTEDEINKLYSTFNEAKSIVTMSAPVSPVAPSRTLHTNNSSLSLTNTSLNSTPLLSTRQLTNVTNIHLINSPGFEWLREIVKPKQEQRKKRQKRSINNNSNNNN